MPGSSNTPLFLNTRPNPMGLDLAELAKDEYLSCISAPIIATEAVAFSELKRALSTTDAFWLFVSRTAVREFAKQVTDLGVDFAPAGGIFAVGPGTKAELLNHYPSLEGIVCPPKSNSESLLTLSQLSAEHASSLFLVKGENGRTLLQEELQHRGFDVGLIDVYRRVEKRFASEIVLTWLQCQLFLATSVDIAQGILNNLSKLDKDECSEQLNKIKWLVLSERIKTSLLEQGIENNLIYVCEDTDNSSIIKQIKQLAK